MKTELLALVRASKEGGQMTLSRLGPDSYPDPSKTSYHDMVTWRVYLTFGRGYFQGAVLRYRGRWTDGREYKDVERELSVEEAVDLFCSTQTADWV